MDKYTYEQKDRKCTQTKKQEGTIDKETDIESLTVLISDELMYKHICKYSCKDKKIDMQNTKKSSS